ncbi:MAG: hypothetical protein J3K34DRAFT_452117 [Monoraphidium minutum]|nr:MAG: hypothetical protein J3K34DRAFT_452117 [Monoraphidium minutum]
MHAEHGAVALVALSAAGWIARLALGARPYEGRVYGLARAGAVQTLVTLGTPHSSLERYPLGRVPERRSGEDPGLPPAALGSSLQLANTLYPDAAALAPVRAVCVCGTGVGGTSASPLQRLAAAAGGWRRWGDAWEEQVAAVSYESTCGAPDADGDGVTPVESALLPGATHVLLPGVRHLPGGRRPWYGSEGVVPLWAVYLTPDPVPARR